MNFLRFLNMGGPQPQRLAGSASDPRPTAAPAASPQVAQSAQKPATPAPVQDAWEKRFAPFWTKDATPLVTREMIAEALEVSGLKIDRARVAEVRALKTKHDGQWQELVEWGHDRTQRIIHQVFSSNEAKHQAGELADPVPDREKLEREIAIEQQRIRADLRTTARQMIAPLNAIAETLEAAARDRAVQVYERDLEEANAVKLPHSVSPWLRGLVWLGMGGVSRQVAQTPGGVGCNDPDRVFWKMLKDL
jgi:hypothetical protein